MAFCIAWSYNRQGDEHQCDTGVCKVSLNIIDRLIHTGATQEFENFLEVVMQWSGDIKWLVYMICC